MHLAWNDWHEPLANTPDSMLPLPFTFNVSDVGLKPYAATPAPEKLLSELFQLGNFSGTGALRFGALRFCLLLRLLRTFARWTTSRS